LPSAFRILAHLTYEPSLSDAVNPPPVSQRQYAKAYRDKAADRAGNLASRLVAGGRRFLEKEWVFEVETKVLIVVSSTTWMR
jgi:hypothetical protein